MSNTYRTCCCFCDGAVSEGESLCSTCRRNEGDFDYDDYLEDSFFEAINRFKHSKFNILKANKLGFTIDEIVEALHDVDGSHPAHHTNWVGFNNN